MKKIIASIIIVALLVSIFSAVYASAETNSAASLAESHEANEILKENYWYLPVSETTANIVEYIGNEDKVNIPSEIDGYKIVGIDDGAFICCGTITEVVIPDGVTSIGKYAFYACNKLSKISFSNTLVSIGRAAFLFDSLKNVVIPDSVQEIERGAFAGNKNLADVKIGTGIQTIGKNAFNYTNIITISGYVNTVAYDFAYSNGIKFKSLGNAPEPATTEPAVTEPPTDTQTEPITTNPIVINPQPTENKPTTETAAPATEPATTQPATEAAPKNTYEDFSYKVNGKAVTITKYNGNLTSVSIPATIDGKPVTVIGKEVFKGNKKLQKVTIGKNVTTIERDAFEKCTKLNKVTFSKSVKQINRYAFAECKKLTSVTLPANLTKLNEGVFNNTGLKSIKITKKIKAINPIALEIDSLKKITVAKNNTKFSDKAGVLYNKKQTKLLICPRKIAKKRLTVPGTVKTIDDFAFSQNKTLTKVTLPKKLKKIGMSAFANVKKLKTITIPKSVNNIEDAAFIKPMKLKGYKKSVAETYAKAYGLKFIKLG